MKYTNNNHYFVAISYYDRNFPVNLETLDSHNNNVNPNLIHNRIIPKVISFPLLSVWGCKKLFISQPDVYYFMITEQFDAVLFK